MQNIMDYDRQLRELLEKKNAVTDVLNIVSEKTKMKKIHLAYGAIAAVGLYLIFGFGSMFLANFIGFLYPAYASIKAIESKATNDDTKWLTYWVVFAAISLIEVFTDILLFWIPLYSFIKCGIFLFLMAPIENNGSVLLYHKVIRPYFLKYESRIDKSVDKLGDMGANAVKQGQFIAEAAGVKLD